MPTADLRSINRAVIDTMLTEAKCTIISHRNSSSYDAYVLSESSLFVFAHKIILKTCGTTTLLHALPTMLKAAKEIGCEPARVQFSRYDFLFPAKQPYPHNCFASEVEYLNSFFPNGKAYVLGPMFTGTNPVDLSDNAGNTPRWHLYLADCAPADGGNATERTFEMVMFDMDREVMRQFYRPPSDDQKTDADGFHYPSTSEDSTMMSGIDTLVPGSEIDAFLFNPCGYSCNGLKDDIYWTIHITPEPQCSFVSFEANLDAESYTSMVQRLVDTFKPGSFCVAVFSSGVDPVAVNDRLVAMESLYDGFVTESSMACVLEGNYTVHCGQFNGIRPATCPSHPARFNKSGCELKTQPIKSPIVGVVVDGEFTNPGYTPGDEISVPKVPSEMDYHSHAFPAPYSHDFGRVQQDLGYDINER